MDFRKCVCGFAKGSLQLAPLMLCLLLLSLVRRSCGQTGTSLALSQNEITEIVDRLNAIRGSVDPPAANMNGLKWNDELATKAAAHARNCRLELDSSLPAQVGQISSVAGSQTLDFIRVIDVSWLASQRLYSYQTNTCSSPGACMQYTQIIRAETTEVGCGVAQCPSVPTFPVPNSIIYFCNFSPKGDLTVQPYVQGTPCSVCPSGRVCVNDICTPAPPTTAMPTIPTTTDVATTEATAPVTTKTTDATTTMVATTQMMPTTTPTPTTRMVLRTTVEINFATTEPVNLPCPVPGPPPHRPRPPHCPPPPRPPPPPPLPPPPPPPPPPPKPRTPPPVPITFLPPVYSATFPPKVVTRTPSVATDIPPAPTIDCTPYTVSNLIKIILKSLRAKQTELERELILDPNNSKKRALHASYKSLLSWWLKNKIKNKENL